MNPQQLDRVGAASRDAGRAGRACAALVVAALSTSCLGGCASTQYAPQVVARGELTLRYDGGFQIYAGRDKLSHGLTYPRLAEYVRCVPQAQEHARRAQSSGRGAVATSVLGGVLGAAGLVGLVGLADQDRIGLWLGGGLALSTVGLTFSIISWRLKNHANGHALDAVNFYNDAVGSLGATCQDLSYPPPAGPAVPDAVQPGALDGAPLPPPATVPPGS